MRSVIGVAALLLLGAGPAAPVDSVGERMFDRLKTLSGDWEGTFEWSEGRTGSGALSVSYSLTGGGSALIENLIMGGVPTMTTVYHLDGPDLRMTHYTAPHATSPGSGRSASTRAQESPSSPWSMSPTSGPRIPGTSRRSPFRSWTLTI